MALITDLDDRTLVEQHRAGDPEAFRRIVSRHHRSLYANALRRLGDPNAAEDAVQDAFLRAFRNIERFDGDYHLDAWLHRIVTNTCHDIGRRRGRDLRLFDRACTEVEVDVPPADEAIEAGTPIEQINEALDSLPESYREVLVLRFVDELSYADVAEQAGISEENARARVSRGRNMLKRMLTTTSALLVWAIPPLRRQTQLGGGTSSEVANQAAAHAHGLATIAATAPAPTSAFAQVSGIIAQAGPAIATAAPAVSTTGPTLKAAVAMGIAASVAIPAGVAVDRAREKPVAPVAAEVEDESAAVAVDAPVPVDRPTTSVAAPSTSAPGVVGTASSGEPTMTAAGDVGAPAEDTTSTPTPASDLDTDSTAPSSGEQQAPASNPNPTPTTAPTSSNEQPPPPPEPVAGPPGQLSASVSVAPAGPAMELAGPLKLEIDGTALVGQLFGKLHIGPAGKDPESPREVERSDLFLDLEDGRRAKLTVQGTAVATTNGAGEQYELDLTFQLEGAADLGLASDGRIEGTFRVSGGSGELGWAIPGATKTS